MLQRLLSVGLIVIATATVGATCLEETAVWGFGRPYSAFGGDGTVVLVSSGSRLVVVDLSDPAMPSVLGSVELGSVARTGVRGADWAAVTDYWGTALVDLVQPERPRLAGRISIAGAMAAVAPNLLAVESGWFVTLFDVTELGDPRLVGSHQARGQVFALAGSSGLLAVGTADGVEVVDVADPAAPARVSWFEASGRSAAMTGTTLYVAGTGLEVVDLSDPATPVVVGRAPLPRTARSVVISGDLVLVDTDYRQLAVVDVHDPSAPELVATVEMETASYLPLAAVDGLALVTTEYRGIGMFDLSAPAAPVAIGDLQLEPPARPYGVAFAGEHVVVADGGDWPDRPATLRTVDVGPGGFEEVGSVELPKRPAYDLAVDGDLAVVTYDCNCVVDLGAVDLAAVDIGDPASPVLLGTLDDVGWFSVGAWGPATPPPDVDLAGTLAVVAGSLPIDLSDPTAPDFVYPDPSRFTDDIALDGSIAWWTRNGDLCATDFADRAAPLDLGCHHLGADLDEVDVDRGILVASAAGPDPGAPEYWLYVVDVSDPQLPVERARLQLPVPFQRLVTGGGRAAFTLSLAGRSQLAVVDLAAPQAPRLVGLAPAVADHIALDAGRIVASTSGSVTLHDPTCDGPVAAATFSWQPSAPLIGEEVTLRAVATDPQAGFAWTFSDGGTAAGAEIRRTFSGLAPVEVTLVASGPSGSTTVRNLVGTRSLLGYSYQGYGYVVPAVAHVDGTGATRWRSDLTLVNRSSAVDAVAFLVRPGGDNTLQPGVRLTIPQGSSTITDLVAGLPGGGETTGALFIQGFLYYVAATSRTYAVAGEGTYGQQVPLLDASGLGRSTTDLLMLRDDAAFRTNLGLVNLRSEPTTVAIELYGADGAPLGTLERTLAPFGYLQENRVLRTIAGGPVPAARARVLAPPGRIVAWASIVDNRSGDAVFTTAAQLVSGPASWVLAVAHANGASGTRWRSELEVCAVRGGDARFSLELVRGAATPPPVTFDLAAGSCVRFPDVVADVFGTTGVGALRIGRVQGLVSASSRTYTETADGATFGQLVPVVQEPLRSSTATQTIPGLVHSADPTVGFRSNLGLVNLEQAPTALRVRYVADGFELLVDRTVYLAPREHRQLNDLLAANGAGDVTSGWVEVVAVGEPAPAGRFLAYLSVIDNVTGDPVLITGR